MDTLTIFWHGMMLELEGEFNPGRPAPRCSNPSAPAFSDSGDPAEYNITGGEIINPSDSESVRLTPEFIDALNEDGGEFSDIILEAIAEAAKEASMPDW